MISSRTLEYPGVEPRGSGVPGAIRGTFGDQSSVPGAPENVGSPFSHKSSGVREVILGQHSHSTSFTCQGF